MPTDKNNSRYDVPVEYNDGPYDDFVNQNFNKLATDVPESGTLEKRPDPQQEFAPDRYYAIDEGQEYYNTGNEWRLLSSIPSTIRPETIHSTDYVMDGDSIQDAINAAPEDGRQIVITPAYDPSVETLPIVVDKDVELIGYGMGRGDKIDFTPLNGDYAFDVQRQPTGAHRGPYFRNIGLFGAGFVVTRGPFVRWENCTVAYAPVDAWKWRGNGEIMFDDVCINCYAFEPQGTGFYVDGLAHNLQLVACMARYCDSYGVFTNAAANVNIVGGNFERNGDFNLLAQGVSTAITGAYLEKGSQNASAPVRDGVHLEGDGGVVQNCYFQGGTDDDGSNSSDVGIVFNDCTGSIAQNCTYNNYANGFLRMEGGAIDCDIMGSTHVALDSTALVDSANGTRPRSHGVIGGHGLSGVDLSTTTGQEYGDVALDNSSNLQAFWTGSAWQPSDGSATI